MNQETFLRFAYEEAALAMAGRKQLLVTLRCALPERKCQNATIGSAYATDIGVLLVTKVSTKATAATEAGRRAMGLNTAEAVPRYWLLGSAGPPMALGHPSPLSMTTPPSLVRAGDKPIRLHCKGHRRWVDCQYPLVVEAALLARRDRNPATLMVPS